MLSGVRHLLKFGDGPSDAIMVDNAEWLDKLEYIPFLREVGRHFSVNRMLTMDSVKLRLEREQPLSFLEFNYSIMQAYDFVELYKRYGCRLQSSGSDQWGNVVSGIELGRRMENVQLFGLTTPLITTASGAKMGKTAAGAVWLNQDMLSVYDYWQFWRNTEDGDVGRFLRLFTDLPLDEIARLEKLQGAELNDAKKVLATEATAVLHGRAAADKAADTARRAFEEGASAEGLPTITAKLPEGILNLAVAAGLASSNSEARKLIANNGLKLNDATVERSHADGGRHGAQQRWRAQTLQRQEKARSGEASLIGGPGRGVGAGACAGAGGCACGAVVVGRRVALVGDMALEDAAENSRRQHGQRIGADIGLFHVAGGGIGGAEDALAFLRRQDVAHQRNVAQHRIDAAGRHQRALQRQGAVRPVDIAVGSGADGAAGHARAVHADHIVLGGEGEIPFIQADAIAAHQIAETGQRAGENKRADQAAG